MTQFNIEVVSDVVCPWCYVGKNRLDAAISQHKSKHPSDTFTITWAPFYLDPDAPKLSVDKQELYVRRFGEERTRMMQVRLLEIGSSLGINFAFGGKTGNTRNAHRIIQLAKTKGEDTQTRVVEELFKAYFEANEDITDDLVLTKAAAQGGLDEGEAIKWLDFGKGGPEVDKEVLSAKQKYISGVPHFTINQKFEVQGAEESSAFLSIFERLKAGDARAANATSGNTC